MSDIELVRLIGTNDGNEVALRLGRVFRDVHGEDEMAATLDSLVDAVVGNTMEQHGDLLSQEQLANEYRKKVTDALMRTIDAIMTSGYGRGAKESRRRRAAA